MQPTIVYTHSEHDRHQDHRAAGRRGGRPPGPVARVLPEPVVHDRLPAHAVRPGRRVRRHQAAVLEAFASQAHRDYMDPELVRATARYWSRWGRERSPSRSRPSVRPRCCGAGAGRGLGRRGTGRRARGDGMRVLVTGAGAGRRGHPLAPAPVGDVEVFAADMDRWASAIYLVERPTGGSCPRASRFVDRPADLRATAIDVLFPTVDVELPCSRGAATSWPRSARCASPSLRTLETCLDKLALARACHGPSACRAPSCSHRARRRLGLPGHRQAAPRAPARAACGWSARRRARRGARTTRTCSSRSCCPGDEFSVDVLADLDGNVIAAVPRARLRVDSGRRGRGRDRARRRPRDRVGGRAGGRADHRRQRPAQARRRRACPRCSRSTRGSRARCR